MRLWGFIYGVGIKRIYLVASKARTLAVLLLPHIKTKPPRTGDLSYQAIKEYLKRLHPRYRESSKEEKSRLLSDAEFFTNKSRKHLIRALSAPEEAFDRKKMSGRPCVYPEDLLLPHIRNLWIAMERISGERMRAALPEWLRFYENEHFDIRTRLLLEKMSSSTIERFLSLLRGEERSSKGLSATRSPSRYMKNRVPLATLDQKIDRPGYMQADTVAHCGTALQGAFANSLTVTDVFSAWTENRAMLTKKAREVRANFVNIKTMLPFSMLGVNVDNGTEFLNGTIIDFMNMREVGSLGIAFTRSRAYKKNDNCYVEQKNFTHVRELFGYERIEEVRSVELMNDIYTTCWNPLQNFFIPTFKIKEKIRIGARVVKKYDVPKTPYQRLMESSFLSQDQKQELRERKLKLNPFTLAQELEKKLGFFFQDLRKSKIGKAS
jgi:hypothetical protein